MSLIRIPGHELEGQERVYLALGSSPYDPKLAEEEEPGYLIVANGHGVTIETVWRQEGFVVPPRVFCYIRSHETGFATHVLERDLLDTSSWLAPVVKS